MLRSAYGGAGVGGMNAALRVASIEHGTLIDEEGIRLMKQNGAYLVPTLIILDEISITKAIEMSDARQVALRRAFRCTRVRCTGLGEQTLSTRGAYAQPPPDSNLPRVGGVE
jgi:hypothetical protein